MTETISSIPRWQSIAKTEAKASWVDRTQLAALFIRDGDRVCDLGAGNQPLKQFLGARCTYLPVDCVSHFPETHLADLSQSDFTLPSQGFNVITALGVFDHIPDLDRLFKRLIELANGTFIVFSYDFKKHNLTKRGALSDFDEGRALFSRYIRDLTPAMIIRRRVTFTGVLGTGDNTLNTKTPATTIACRRMLFAEYFLVRYFGVKMISLRWV